MKYINFVLFLLLFTKCENNSVNSQELEQIAVDFNKKGPRMIDSETRIENIQIKGTNTVVYNYTLVNLLYENVDTTEFKNLLRPGIISVIKVSPEMKKLKDQKANFEYCYSDKKHHLIYNFKISCKDYQ